MAWLQRGLTSAVAVAGGDSHDHARLNRRMVASLSEGTSLNTELFVLKMKDLTKLMRGSNDHRQFQKFQQFSGQAWSIIEYLCGERAPEERKTAFRAFLKDGRSNIHQEECFVEHFGFGFGPLLDRWRQWVLDQGIGSYEPPSPRVRKAWLDRVLPIIRNSQAKRGDHILAIREVGSAGYVLGADALIDLLRERGEIPKEEIVWALAMISGMAWGDDPDRWQSWWEGLPMTWTPPQSQGVDTDTAARIQTEDDSIGRQRLRERSWEGEAPSAAVPKTKESASTSAGPSTSAS
jgi:hypothetical protein